MKIAIDGTVFQQPITGIAKGTRCLYQNCVELMQSLDVIVIHQKPLTCAFSPKIKSTQLAKAVPNALWRSFALPVYVSRLKPTFLHFPWNGFVPKHVSGTKVITTLHDVLPLIIPNYFAFKQAEQAYRNRVQNDIDRSDLLLTISEFSKKEILRSFNVSAEPVVIHYAPTIHTSSLLPTFSDGNIHDYFLYVGGYDKRKGIESLLKVFTQLHKEEKLRSKLLLAGSRLCYSQELKRLIDEGLRVKAIAELGYVSDSVLAELYANAKALIYPSKFEGFGLPPLEAMASGCPVITTKCAALPEICGDAVYYTDPDDEEAFASSIIDLHNDQELRDKLARRGLKQASKFSWDEASRVFLDEMFKLVSET
jgi:glycosyltransferase involved in cell wall biosynthesis